MTQLHSTIAPARPASSDQDGHNASPTRRSQGTPTPLPLDEIGAAIRSIRYGVVQIIIQDGLAQALQSDGRTKTFALVGEEGYAANVQLIRNTDGEDAGDLSADTFVDGLLHKSNLLAAVLVGVRNSLFFKADDPLAIGLFGGAFSIGDGRDASLGGGGGAGAKH